MRLIFSPRSHHSPPSAPPVVLLQRLAALFGQHNPQSQRLSQGWSFCVDEAIDTAALLALREDPTIGGDINLVPDAPDIRLVAFDMDATLVAVETLDRLADRVGCAEAVAALTQKAMEGSVSYADNLRQRVRLLTGLSEKTINDLAHDKQALPLNEGAALCVAALKKQHRLVVLISGGFTHFANPLKTELGLDAIDCNVLEINHGQLTGRVLDPIIDAEGKKQALLALMKKHHLQTHQVMAVGDGANDLLMLQTAGMGVAYRGKDLVRQHIALQLNHAPLNALLDFL